MRFRHLDYPESTPVGELGPAALDDLLDRGDLELSTLRAYARALGARLVLSLEWPGESEATSLALPVRGRRQ